LAAEHYKIISFNHSEPFDTAQGKLHEEFRSPEITLTLSLSPQGRGEQALNFDF